MLNNHKCVEAHSIVANQATFDEYNLKQDPDNIFTCLEVFWMK